MVIKRFRYVAFVLGFLLAGQARSEAGDEVALKQASERGHQIFVLDEAAWVSTDELLRKVPNPHEAGIAGWIVEEEPDRLHSTFYRLEGSRGVAAFVADTRGREVLGSHAIGPQDDNHLTPVEARMVQAREVARRQPVMRCTEGGMNTVVIPPQSAEQPVDVYVLSPQVRRDEYPLGGHQLFRIDERGAVISRRNFTKSCPKLSRAPAGSAQPVGLFVTHLLDTTPTEIHVFTSLAAGLPIFVGAPVSMLPNARAYRVWKVDGARITMERGVQP